MGYLHLSPLFRIRIRCQRHTERSRPYTRNRTVCEKWLLLLAPNKCMGPWALRSTPRPSPVSHFGVCYEILSLDYVGGDRHDKSCRHARGCYKTLHIPSWTNKFLKLVYPADKKTWREVDSAPPTVHPFETFVCFHLRKQHHHHVASLHTLISYSARYNNAFLLIT